MNSLVDIILELQNELDYSQDEIDDLNTAIFERTCEVEDLLNRNENLLNKIKEMG